MPELESIHRRYVGRGLRVIGITEMDPSRDQALRFVAEAGVTYPILLDPGARIGQLYALEAHPTTVILDARGRVRYVNAGYLRGEAQDYRARRPGGARRREGESMTAGAWRRARGTGSRTSGLIGAAALAATIASARPALAHEPLWGETPTIFGPSVFHPEIRIGFLRRGGSPDPGEQSSEDIDQEYGLQYGINRFVNVRVTISVMHMTMEENTAGAGEEAVD